MSSEPAEGRAAAARREAGVQVERLEINTDRAQALMAQLERTGAELTEARDQIENLEQALMSSRCIGMAIGILMARRQVDAAEAFLLLRQASQQTHRKVREIADDVVVTGELPAA